MCGTRGKKADEKGIQEDDTDTEKMASKPEAEAQKKDTNNKTIPPEQDIEMTGSNEDEQRKQLIDDRLKNIYSNFEASQSVLAFFWLFKGQS